MKRALELTVLIGLIAAASACQSTGADGHSVQTEPPMSFADLWRIYTHCRTAHDPAALVLDAAQLNRATRSGEHRLPGLLRPLWPLIEDQPIRLAADPREMAADCTLRAGQAAADAGWYDIAIKLYRAVILHHSEEPYAYYRGQAKTRLVELLQQASIAPPSDSPVQAETPHASRGENRSE